MNLFLVFEWPVQHRNSKWNIFVGEELWTSRQCVIMTLCPIADKVCTALIIQFIYSCTYWLLKPVTVSHMKLTNTKCTKKKNTLDEKKK